ncbi:expressed unknown protein [Seminavis robusta]|uniref:Uncharacterized protein n=1 Tax=Seminavis robusta TaxID=568900 RepID=A0A9N8H1U3_9STRA|nr:expressed unknown protein [Seminavis robusta]|eukprot:Sro49_g028580.1 n/a (294) ;mRNA; r:31932-33437
MPRRLSDYVVSVDLSNEWRRHLVWSKKNGDDLKALVTGRYTSTSVFLSLLFSTEMAVIYSPSRPADEIREALENKEIHKVEFWAGLALCVSIFFSVSALVANFTAWSVFSSLSTENAPIVLRSNVGLYSAQLPSRLVVLALYLFFAVIVLTWWVVMPGEAAFFLTLGGFLVIVHIIQTFSATANLVMLTGAMANMPIIEEDEEVHLSPGQLSDILIERARLAKKLKVDVMKQYRVDYQQLLREVEDGTLQFPISESEYNLRASKMVHMRRQMPSRFLDVRVGSELDMVDEEHG